MDTSKQTFTIDLNLRLLFGLVVNGFQDGYTMEQAQRREPMPEYPNPGTVHCVLLDLRSRRGR
jgi:hypothetical protein